MKISHMKKDELFEGFYLIKSADLRQTRAGKNYLAFTFQDDSGEIDGKLWDAQPHNIEAFTAGKVVHMKGRREVYNNTPQVNQITLRLPQAGEPNDPADFKVKSPVDVKEIRDYMSQMIFKIENPVWQRIVRNLYTKYDKEFYSYPAAKTNHHAFETGWLIIRRPWYVWQTLLAKFILSSIRVCSMRGLCCTTWLRSSS
ncbi:cmp-binding-factor 1 [Streptococcus pneumoniae]|nr:cmp-binding-factor 1 [Streptococcus pneumoniae]